MSSGDISHFTKQVSRSHLTLTRGSQNSALRLFIAYLYCEFSSAFMFTRFRRAGSSRRNLESGKRVLGSRDTSRGPLLVRASRISTILRFGTRTKVLFTRGNAVTGTCQACKNVTFDDISGVSS